MWGEGGRDQGVARLVLTGCGIAVSEIIRVIRDAAFKFVSLRPKSHLIAPNRKWTQKNCLREQTHTNELQLVFVNPSQQIVLYRQILRLCNKFSKLSFKIRLNSQI